MKVYAPLIVLAVCSGCASIRLSKPAVVHLPVRSFVPDIMLTALAEGKLRVRNGCVRLVGRGGGDGELVIWPKNSRLVSEGRHQVILVGGSDERFKLGSRVRLGGGGSNDIVPEGLTGALPAKCGGPYFHAN